MSNITDVYWTANSLSLHTHAWAVKTKGGSRWSPPDKRGEDLVVPFRRGSRSQRKVRESKGLDLPMWVKPVDQDGVPYPGLDLEQAAEKNWRTLMSYVDVPGQFPLVKRWWDDTTVKSATAQAELLEGPEPTHVGGKLYEFTLSLFLADPYFYAAPATIGTGAVTVAGDVETDRYVLTFTGGTNPRLTMPDGNWIQYQGTPGSPVVIDMEEGLAMIGSNYVNGLIVRNPDFPDWPVLPAGAVNLVLSGGGSASIQYEAAYR